MFGEGVWYIFFYTRIGRPTVGRKRQRRSSPAPQYRVRRKKSYAGTSHPYMAREGPFPRSDATDIFVFTTKTFIETDSVNLPNSKTHPNLGWHNIPKVKPKCAIFDRAAIPESYNSTQEGIFAVQRFYSRGFPRRRARDIRTSENAADSYIEGSISHGCGDSTSKRNYATYAKEGSERKHFDGMYPYGDPGRNAPSCTPPLVFYALPKQGESSKLPPEVHSDRLESVATDRFPAPVLIRGTDAPSSPSTAKRPTPMRKHPLSMSLRPVAISGKTQPSIFRKREGTQSAGTWIIGRNRRTFYRKQWAAFCHPMSRFLWIRGVALDRETSAQIAQDKGDARQERLETYHQTQTARGYKPNVYTIGSAIASQNKDASLDSPLARLRDLLDRPSTESELENLSATFALPG